MFSWSRSDTSNSRKPFLESPNHVIISSGIIDREDDISVFEATSYSSTLRSPTNPDESDQQLSSAAPSAITLQRADEQAEQENCISYYAQLKAHLAALHEMLGGDNSMIPGLQQPTSPSTSKKSGSCEGVLPSAVAAAACKDIRDWIVVIAGLHPLLEGSASLGKKERPPTCNNRGKGAEERLSNNKPTISVVVPPIQNSSIIIGLRNRILDFLPTPSTSRSTNDPTMRVYNSVMYLTHLCAIRCTSVLYFNLPKLLSTERPLAVTTVTLDDVHYNALEYTEKENTSGYIYDSGISSKQNLEAQQSYYVQNQTALVVIVTDAVDGLAEALTNHISFAPYPMSSSHTSSTHPNAASTTLKFTMKCCVDFLKDYMKLVGLVTKKLAKLSATLAVEGSSNPLLSAISQVHDPPTVQIDDDSSIVGLRELLKQVKDNRLYEILFTPMIPPFTIKQCEKLASLGRGNTPVAESVKVEYDAALQHSITQNALRIRAALQKLSGLVTSPVTFLLRVVSALGAQGKVGVGGSSSTSSGAASNRLLLLEDRITNRIRRSKPTQSPGGRPMTTSGSTEAAELHNSNNGQIKGPEVTTTGNATAAVVKPSHILCREDAIEVLFQVCEVVSTPSHGLCGGRPLFAFAQKLQARVTVVPLEDNEDIISSTKPAKENVDVSKICGHKAKLRAIPFSSGVLSIYECLVFELIPPPVYHILKTLSTHCRDDDEGGLLALRLLWDAITVIDPLVLRWTLSHSSARKQLVDGLLTMIVSPHELVLNASCMVLHFIIKKAFAESIQELAYLYTHCVLKMLFDGHVSLSSLDTLAEGTSSSASYSAAADTSSRELVMAQHPPISHRLIILKHFTDTFLVSAPPLPEAEDAMATRGPLLIQLYQLLDLNSDIEKCDVIQLLMASLGKLFPYDYVDKMGGKGDVSGAINGESYKDMGNSYHFQHKHQTNDDEDDDVITVSNTTVVMAAVAAVSQLLKTLAFTILQQNELGADISTVARISNARDNKKDLYTKILYINENPVKGIIKAFGLTNGDMTNIETEMGSGIHCMIEEKNNKEKDGSVDQAVQTTSIAKTKSLEFNDIPEVPDRLRRKCNELVDFLLTTPSISRAAIGEFLSDNSFFPLQCCRELMSRLPLKGASVPNALCEMLSVLELPKEGQRIERIIEFFANSYFIANNGIVAASVFPFSNADACFIVAVATVMLNTDLHNPKVSSKMNQQTFVGQLRGCNNGQDFPTGFVDAIFTSISKQPLTSRGDMTGGNVLSSSCSAETASSVGSILGGRMDIFLSNDERKDVQFGLSKQKMISEIRSMIQKRGKQYFSDEGINSRAISAEIAKDIFIATWDSTFRILTTGLCGHTFSTITTIEDQMSFVEVCTSGLSNSFLCAAAFNYPHECEVTISSLLKICSTVKEVQAPVAEIILEVSASAFAIENFTSSCWMDLFQLLTMVRKGQIISLRDGGATTVAELSDLVWASIEELVRDVDIGAQQLAIARLRISQTNSTKEEDDEEQQNILYNYERKKQSLVRLLEGLATGALSVAPHDGLTLGCYCASIRRVLTFSVSKEKMKELRLSEIDALFGASVTPLSAPLDGHQEKSSSSDPLLSGTLRAVSTYGMNRWVHDLFVGLVTRASISDECLQIVTESIVTCLMESWSAAHCPLLHSSFHPPNCSFGILRSIFDCTKMTSNLCSEYRQNPNSQEDAKKKGHQSPIHPSLVKLHLIKGMRVLGLQILSGHKDSSFSSTGGGCDEPKIPRQLSSSPIIQLTNVPLDQPPFYQEFVEEAWTIIAQVLAKAMFEFYTVGTEVCKVAAITLREMIVASCDPSATVLPSSSSLLKFESLFSSGALYSLAPQSSFSLVLNATYVQKYHSLGVLYIRRKLGEAAFIGAMCGDVATARACLQQLVTIAVSTHQLLVSEVKSTFPSDIQVDTNTAANLSLERDACNSVTIDALRYVVLTIRNEKDIVRGDAIQACRSLLSKLRQRYIASIAVMMCEVLLSAMSPSAAGTDGTYYHHLKNETTDIRIGEGMRNNKATEIPEQSFSESFINDPYYAPFFTLGLEPASKQNITSTETNSDPTIFCPSVLKRSSRAAFCTTLPALLEFFNKDIMEALLSHNIPMVANHIIRNCLVPLVVSHNEVVDEVTSVYSLPATTSSSSAASIASCRSLCAKHLMEMIKWTAPADKCSNDTTTHGMHILLTGCEVLMETIGFIIASFFVPKTDNELIATCIEGDSNMSNQNSSFKKSTEIVKNPKNDLRISPNSDIESSDKVIDKYIRDVHQVMAERSMINLSHRPRSPPPRTMIGFSQSSKLSAGSLLLPHLSILSILFGCLPKAVANTANAHRSQFCNTSVINNNDVAGAEDDITTALESTFLSCGLNGSTHSLVPLQGPMVTIDNEVFAAMIQKVVHTTLENYTYYVNNEWNGSVKTLNAPSSGQEGIDNSMSSRQSTSISHQVRNRQLELLRNSTASIIKGGFITLLDTSIRLLSSPDNEEEVKEFNATEDTLDCQQRVLLSTTLNLLSVFWRKPIDGTSLYMHCFSSTSRLCTTIEQRGHIIKDYCLVQEALDTCVGAWWRFVDDVLVNRNQDNENSIAAVTFPGENTTNDLHIGLTKPHKRSFSVLAKRLWDCMRRPEVFQACVEALPGEESITLQQAHLTSVPLLPSTSLSLSSVPNPSSIHIRAAALKKYLIMYYEIEMK